MYEDVILHRTFDNYVCTTICLYFHFAKSNFTDLFETNISYNISREVSRFNSLICAPKI